MRKLFSLLLLSFFFLSCDNSGQNSTSGNSATMSGDTMGDTRGQKGAGVDNTGGTPGPGTLTDTSGGKTDTLDHTSRKGK